MNKGFLKVQIQNFFKRLGIAIAVLVFFVLIIAVLDANKTPDPSYRKYKVQLSNWVGSNWYECDSVIWINDKNIKLLNKEDNEPFMSLVVPDDVVIRVHLNKE